MTYSYTYKKTCKQCYGDLEEKAYTPHPDYPDGLDGTCRACRRDNRATYSPLTQEIYRAKHYPDGMKKCTKCEVSKELKSYSKRKRHRDGFSYVCRPCAKGINKPYVPEKIEKTEITKKRVLFSM